MNRRKATAIAGVLTATAIMLTACTPSDPEPTKTPTTSATPTPTPTSSQPTQQPVTAPVDAATAIADANKAYIGFTNAQFELFENPQLGVQHLTGYAFEGSPVWTFLEDSIRMNQEKGITISGEPSKWTLNEAMSYTAPATNQSTGETLEFGSALLYGCADNTGLVVTGSDLPKGSFPYMAQLIYDAAEGVWLVRENQYLTGEGAPLC